MTQNSSALAVMFPAAFADYVHTVTWLSPCIDGRLNILLQHVLSHMLMHIVEHGDHQTACDMAQSDFVSCQATHQMFLKMRFLWPQASMYFW